MKLKMSVVTPCYNEIERIEKYLEVLENQTVKPEVIIVDGGSTDGTLPILRKFVKRYKNAKLFVEKKERSPAKARNMGWKAAKGDIVYLMDVDSQIEKNFTKKIIKEFEKNPGVDAIRFVCKPKFPKKFSNVFEKALFYKDERGDGRLIIFARKAIKKLGYSDPSLGFGEDRAWGKKWSKLKIVETSTALVQSKSGYLNARKFFQRYSWYGRTLPRFLKKHFEFKIFLGLCISIAILLLTFTFWVHLYLTYLFGILLLLIFL
ncbi:glycosyltransferase family 2 protein, partial [Candidatus Woesearchaeota archaeon]|nr:glycosyltransferase family 2 protein [Candidatus Woesearchaeota archaeon]